MKTRTCMHNYIRIQIQVTKAYQPFKSKSKKEKVFLVVAQSTSNDTINKCKGI